MVTMHAPALLGAALAAAMPSIKPITRRRGRPAELIAAPKNARVLEGKTFRNTQCMSR
jgi:hypothetical protein